MGGGEKVEERAGELKSVYDESRLYTGTHNTTSLGSVLPFAKQAVVLPKLMVPP